MIYIADDTLYNLELYKSVLGDDFKIKTFLTGEKLLKALEKNIPKLIILDYNMPGLNGIETLKKIRKSFKNIPVIICSAEDINQFRKEAQKYKIVDIVKIPLRTNDFLDTVKVVLGDMEPIEKLSNLTKKLPFYTNGK